MKNKLKNYLKLGIFLFGITFVMVNCERGEIIQEDLSNKFPYKIKIDHFDTFSKEIRFNNAIESLNQNNSYNKNTVDEDFTIDSTSVKQITTDNYTSYTFLIKREIDSVQFFENLVITMDSLETIESFILKYTPTQEMEYIEHHDSYTFVGDVELSPINFDTSGFSSKTETNEFCFPVTTVYCTQTGTVNGRTYNGIHIANNDCQDSNYFIPVTTDQCFTTGGGTTPPPGDTSNTGDGTDDCDTCGSTGTNGNTPIVTSQVTPNDNDPNPPCKQLKDSISDVPLIKTRLNQLRIAAATGNFEKGLKVLKHNITNEYIPSEVLNENNGPRFIKIKVNPFIVVVAHTHPENETYAMFSGPDIIKMGEIMKHNQFSSTTTVDPLSITHILYPKEVGKFFALRFDDLESAQKLLAIYNDIQEKEDFEDELKDLYEGDYDNGGLPDTDIYKQQHHLFTLFEKFGLNMSLFEANYDGNGLVDNWQKIIIGDNGNLENEICN